MKTHTKLPFWILRAGKLLPEVIVATVFIVIQLQHVNSDFWNDEIYTLKHFTFVPLETILTDYHVPNNHILFNFINSIYLEIIGVDSLHALMDAPYKLRIVPLIYVAFTLFITYQTGWKFFNRRIALLSCIILMTTAAYYNFSLQIRGYGLSTLLFGCLVFFTLSYLKSTKKRSLILIVVFSALLFYAIPSNIYALACMMFIMGLYWLAAAIRAWKVDGGLKNKAVPGVRYLRLIFAMVLGILVALAGYLPIFEEVFMNKYVVAGSPFDFAKLDKYFSHVCSAMLSGRWLMLICGLVLLILLIRQRKVKIQLLVIIVLCFLPLTFPFLRGDEAPLRVFVIFAPYYALLFAVGVHRTWKIFVKQNSWRDYGWIVLILFYSLYTFYEEIDRADAYLMNDIVEGGRSQDLDHQYYSHHYEPLAVIKSFNERYSGELPVIVDGCEPHGLPNYLDKFNIRHYNTYFQDHALDSLLLEKDSVYVITNHPNAYEHINEYRKIQMHESLSYHNVILLHRKKALKKITEQLRAINENYQDSIGFVFNVYNKKIFSTAVNEDKLHFYDPENPHKYSALIEFCKKTPYICYVETYNEHSSTVNAIVNDRRKQIANLSFEGLTNYFYINKAIKTQPDSETMYANDFESGRDSAVLLDSTTRYSGRFSERLDADHLYSSGFSYASNVQDEKLSLLVDFYGRFERGTKTVVVLTVTREKEQVLWRGQPVAPYFNSNEEWQKIIATFRWQETLQPGDIIKIYIWNPEKENAWIDDFKVRSTK
ncbi:MAG: ArnT family glycosyltransferase [Bacteroidota bacterium]